MGGLDAQSMAWAITAGNRTITDYEVWSLANNLENGVEADL